MDAKVDLAIVGGGIIGLATAYSVLLRNPNTKVVILEKESTLGVHQSSHNSGVIHSGLYYKPGSLKAKNCIDGYKLLLKFCQENEIAHEVCGKIVIATSEQQTAQLDKLENRGIQNGLAGIRRISRSEITEFEPHCSGIAGLFIPQTGIIDYRSVINHLVKKIQDLGGEVLACQEVLEIEEIESGVRISTANLQIETRSLVTCGGLQSDRLAAMTFPKLDLRIIPFRGEYFELKKAASHLVRNLIYPVPDPSFPFLGVHFTRRIDGSIECGPNAVLAFAREGYRKTDISVRDLQQTVSWPGFRKIARRHWRAGLGEYHRSISKKAFVAALRKLVPAITEDDLVPSGAGVRAQACSRDGLLLDDFEIRQSGRVIHVCNAPSPAATASLSVGATVAARVMTVLG